MDEPSVNLFDVYQQKKAGIDELFYPSGRARESQQWLYDYLHQLNIGTLSQYQKKALEILEHAGAYFSLSLEGERQKRVLPFDVIPRVISASTWQKVKRGLQQRVVALNLFLQDIYTKQKILEQNRTLFHLVSTCPSFMRKMVGFSPSSRNYLAVSGIDIIIDQNFNLKVLEDNLKIPSGVSFALKNRQISKQLYSALFREHQIYSIEQYSLKLRMLLESLSSHLKGKIVVLSPGIYNSAYFEHSFLAKEMGVGLVEGQDLYVENRKVYLKTESGIERIKAIYRRIEENFLDPHYGASNSLIGVSHLYESYLAGEVVLANALGNGVADDKAIYPFVPEMIKYYLGETPILDQVQTYSCLCQKEQRYVLEHLDQLVIKSTNGSGGYDIFIGLQANQSEREKMQAKLKADPRYYIAQPLIELSNHPTYVAGDLIPKRVDLRAFVLNGNDPWVLPGGLTRVALKQGSYIVNSSQGGGTKDTWIKEG